MNNQSRKSYKKFTVWQKAHSFARAVYKAQKEFPSSEEYGLRSQLRRAALSVPTNIVEGTARQSQRELKQFLNISLGSLAEAEYLLEFSLEEGMLSKETYDNLDGLRYETGCLLWKFYQSI